MREVQVYFSADGKAPFSVWLEKLRDRRAVLAIDRRILRLMQGNFGDHKFCTQGVWELRIDFGPGYRIYYGEDGDKIVLLLCAGDKSSQSSDIQRAVRFLTDWKDSKDEK